MISNGANTNEDQQLPRYEKEESNQNQKKTIKTTNQRIRNEKLRNNLITTNNTSIRMFRNVLHNNCGGFSLGKWKLL